MSRALMVWGCTSDAGKSLLATALCRWFSDRGLRVAPYKAQNMSNNARVADGGEMGCAQHFQALAARRVPDVRMNPVLLKPERDTASQVVVMGEVDRSFEAMDWRSRSPLLWERARQPLRELLAENDLVIMEGAGSPAEINLASCDYVNLLAAREARATALLVSDIDRGGSFAHLFGTWSLLPDDLRGSVKGFVLNKFRGDASLLAPGPELLRARTGVPLLGVLPRISHGLPDEDAVSLDQFPAPTGAIRFRVRVVAWPHISNFDEFRRLAQWPGVEVLPVRSPSDLREADLVVLPGSKSTPSDIAWLRSRGLDRAIAEFAATGRPVLGVCGGLQALGRSIEDAHGNEGSCDGLDLLPIRTVHAEVKRTRRTDAAIPAVDGFWHKISGLRASGYEIRAGVSSDASGEGLFFHSGNVFGTYLHGLFEDARVLAALFGGDPAAPDPLEETFDMLAKLVEERMDTKTLASLAEPLPLVEGTRNLRDADSTGGAANPGDSASERTCPAGFEFPQPAAWPARLCVLTGGVRSGKSSTAEKIAAEWGGRNVTYLATAQGLDDEMRDRIAKHRSDRSERGWETIEEPLDAASAMERASHDVVLLDCITLLVTNLLLSGGADAVRDGIDRLLDAWARSGKSLVVVTNEVGLGIVPENALAREYRDLLGWTNQRLVERSTEAWFMVSGRKLSLI